MNSNPNSKRINKHIFTYEAIAITLIVGMVVFMMLSRTNWLEECEVPFLQVKEDNAEWYRVYEDGRRERITLPATFKDAKAGETVVIEGTVRSSITQKDYFSTLANRQNMRIYIDGALRAKTEQKFTYFRWPAVVSRYIFTPVDIYDIGSTIRIEGTTPFEGERVFEPLFYGEKLALELHYLKEQLYTVMVTVLLVLMGVICIILGIVLRALSENRVRIDYMGSAMILVALWNLTLNDVSFFLFTNIIAIRYVPEMALSLLPLLIALYMDGVQERRYHKQYMCFYAVTVASVFLCLLLHVTGILLCPKSIVIPIMLLFVLFGLFVFFTLKDYRLGFAKNYRLIIIEMSIMAAAGLAQGLVSMFVDKLNNEVFLTGCLIMMPFILTDGLEFVFMMEDDRKKAEVNAQVKSQFLATMSHEIRTPINAVLGMNEIILRESSEENILNYASDIESAGKLLLSVVNDILDFSKLDSGKMDIVTTEYSVYELIMSCMHMIENRAKEKNLGLKIDADPEMPAVLCGDQVRIQQVLTNLLTNAVKYTREGTVTLKVGSKNEDGAFMLVAEVIDTGIGIKEENIGSLFNSFERLDLIKNAKIEGTGLGLAISDRLVKLMGGRIDVTSVYGSGSTFKLIVPQSAVGEEKLGIVDFSEEKHKKVAISKDLFKTKDIRIIIVDDVALNLKVASMMLKNTGIEVHTAASGAECLKKLTQFRYDVIFLDHMMPEMDGVETRRRMYTLEGNLNEGVPVIMLTANVSANAGEEYKDIGFDDYLSKPFSVTDIEKMLMTHLPEERLNVQ